MTIDQMQRVNTALVLTLQGECVLLPEIPENEDNLSHYDSRTKRTKEFRRTEVPHEWECVSDAAHVPDLSDVFRVTMPDGSRWDIPVKFIAEHRAVSIHMEGLASEFVDLRDALEATKRAFESEAVIREWVAGHINWLQVESVATHYSPGTGKLPLGMSYDDGLRSGEAEVIPYGHELGPDEITVLKAVAEGGRDEYRFSEVKPLCPGLSVFNILRAIICLQQRGLLERIEFGCKVTSYGRLYHGLFLVNDWE